jgi:hypothetical protein
VNWVTLMATNDVGLSSSRDIRLVATLFLEVNGSLLRDTGLAWSTGGDAPWFGQSLTTRDGHPTAQAGALGDSQYSWIQAAFAGPGRLSFWWKVSSETNRDILIFNCGAVSNWISGTVDWQRQVLFVPAGPLTATWEYSKNDRTSAGFDTAWLDAVTFEPGSWLEWSDAGQGILLHGVPGRLYQLQMAPGSTNWIDNSSWLPAAPMFIGTQAPLSFAPGDTGVDALLYRLRDMTP